MKARWIALISGLALIGALVLIGVGMAQAMGANGRGSFWESWQTASQQTPTGQGAMMNDYGPNGGANSPGGMMNGNGMMNGYGSGQATQNPSSAAPVSSTAVTLQNFAFHPANLQVKVGTTVTWINLDTATHTVTFRDSSL